MFGSKKKSIVGLDIGSSALKAVELRPVRNGFELLHIAHHNLQSDTIVDGHIIDLNHVADSINRVWADNGIKTSQVATSLSGHAVIVKKILLPQMSSEELDEQIHWEAEQYIPFDINDVNLYHEVIGHDASGQNMDVLLVACKRDKIAQFTQVISQSGKQPVIVDVDAFALQNAYVVNYSPSPNQTVALLDIGASVMTINVVRGATSIFTRDISAGGNQYTDLLQKELNLTFEQAESLKRGAGFDDQNEYQAAQTAMQSVSEMLALEVQRTLDFFRATAVDSPSIDRMLIAGGSSKVEHLCDYLSEKFQMPVERFDAFRAIRYDRKRFDDEYLRELSPNMAVAVGLAVRQAEEGNLVRVNLLEGTAEHRVAVQKTKVAARRGQQLFMVAAALSIFLIAIAVDHLWTTNARTEAQAQLDHEQEVATKLEADVQKKNEIEAELKQVEERIKVIKQLRAEQKGPVAMMSAINERMPVGAVDFRLDQIIQKGTHLQIVGTSLNQQVIADFARQLEFSNGLFSNLVPTIESTEVKTDDVADRKEADKTADKGDKKDAKADKKDAKKDDTKAEAEMARIFRFTIDCDYNKPRADESKDGKAAAPPAGK